MNANKPHAAVSRSASLAVALVLCLQSGCFFGKDQLHLQNPSPCHFQCDINHVAPLDPECHGYHPTCWAPWSGDCCPCPPPATGVTQPSAFPAESVELPAAEPHRAAPPAEENPATPQPNDLPPPEMNAPTAPPANPLPEMDSKSSDAVQQAPKAVQPPSEPTPAPETTPPPTDSPQPATQLPSLIPPGREFQSQDKSSALRRDEKLKRTSALEEKLKKIRRENPLRPLDAPALEIPEPSPTPVTDIPRLIAPAPCSIRLVPSEAESK